jgi:DNA-binding response OmpR family regulator
MSKKIIFAVEDEPDILELLRFNLKQEGYEVYSFSKGETMLEKLNHTQPDLLLLDIMLPGMDGFEICKTIRRKYDFPILFISARQEEIDKILGLELGADDYITKPFSVRELMARIKVRLRVPRNTETQKSVLVRGPFEINPFALQILVKGIPLDLTKNEFNLLKYFLENPKRVFTRNQLLEAVWQEEFEGYERAVDGTIKRLRKKITAILLKDPIKTMRGFGYQFEWESPKKS